MSDAIIFSPCRGVEDIPALQAFFDEMLPAPYPRAFYEEAVGRCSVPEAALPALLGGGGKGMWWYSVQMAVHRGRLVGGAIIAVASLEEARRQVSLPFAFEARGSEEGGGGGGGDDLGAHVLLLAVGLPPYRRRGIGSELLHRGLEGALRACPALAQRVRLAFLTCAAEQVPFYQACHFRRLGVLPGHYPESYRLPGTDGCASIMLLPLRVTIRLQRLLDFIRKAQWLDDHDSALYTRLLLYLKFSRSAFRLFGVDVTARFVLRSTALLSGLFSIVVFRLI